jgi:AraC-like DNA-binding protein
MEQSCIDRVKKFVNGHLKQEFTLNEIADHAGYSAFHFAREFKSAMGSSVMDYVREQRIHASTKDIAGGKNICDIAMDYCFDTHAGFTKAFTAIYGCTPKDYFEYAEKQKTNKGVKLMDTSKIVIRHICQDDVQDLWENVYSGMTPRQITEDKILWGIDLYKKGEGLSLVAEVDGKVVMNLPITKPTWLPIGIVWDNNYVSDNGGDNDIIMTKMLEELKRQAKLHLSINTLIKPSGENDDSSQAFEKFGFTRAFVSNGWDYLMLAL